MTCTLETYYILLTNVTLIHLILKKYKFIFITDMIFKKTFTHLVTFSSAPFILPNINLVLFSAWRTSLNVFYSVGLLLMISFSSCMCEGLYSSLFYQRFFTGYRIKVWQFFPLQCFKYVSLSSCCTVFNATSAFIRIFVLCYTMCSFSLAALNIFFLSVVLINLVIMC